MGFYLFTSISQGVSHIQIHENWYYISTTWDGWGGGIYIQDLCNIQKAFFLTQMREVLKN